ncbi:retrovirus-related pol polyprotein from transposon TNT 1-94 [Tanacetum coccineum]
MPNQTRTTQLPQDIRKTNKSLSLSTGVIPTTSVSRPQLQSNKLKDRVMHNNSQGKKQQVEDHFRNFKVSNNKMFVTACNDSLNAKTSNVNFVCVTCGKCVLNDNHDLCVLYYINGVNTRTKQPIVVPISTRKPKRTVNQSVTTPLKKTVDVQSTNQKPRSNMSMLVRHVDGGNKSRTTNILESIKLRGSTLSNTPLSSNSFAARTVKFGNDQIASILGYGDLVQGNVTIKRVYYVKGLNHNLFSVGQFCNADLEVAFRKSTCYICDLKGNDLLTGSRGTNLFSITLQDTSTPNPICLMAKASSSRAWLWNHRLSHLNFDTINLISMYDIMTGLPKLKFVKDHLCSSYELGKAKRKSFKTKTTPSSKRRLQILHMDLCGPMRVESFNDHVNSDPVPQCPTMALEQDSLSSDPQSQENVYHAAETSSAVNATDAPNQRQQQHTTPSTSTTTETISQAPTQAPILPGTRMRGDIPQYVDSSNMHTFYQRHPLEHHWTKDHLLEQVIRNPSQLIRTRRQLETDGEMCMFTLTVSRTEPKNIKEVMADFAWIEAMQEELHQFD